MRSRQAGIFIITAVILCLTCSGGTGSFGAPPLPAGCFTSPEGVETCLRSMAGNYPGYTALRSAGKSEEGRDIWVLEISAPSADGVKKPAVQVNGGIHGDEQLSTGICLKLAEYLLSGNADNIVENFSVHIMPAVNPDGLAAGTRGNSGGVDLNRNFGYNWHEEEDNNGEAPFDQSESAAVRDDFLSQGYGMAVSLHTSAFAEDIGIYAPWDAIDSSADNFIEYYLPNYRIIEEIGTAYAETIASENPHPFSSFFHFDEGGNWYLMNGSLGDWAMGTMGSVTYTIELYPGKDFTPDDADLLDEVWEAHRPAMLDLIMKSGLGSGGIVRGPGGTPLQGADLRLEVLGETAGRSFTAEEYRDLSGVTASDGSFRFLTGEGSYNLTVSCGGFESRTLGIEVDGGGLTRPGGTAYEFFPDYILQSQ